MSLKKALHDARMSDGKIKRGQRDVNTAKKENFFLWCNDLQTQSKCSGKLLLPTHSEMDKNRRDCVCKGAKNNNMMKKYIYLLPRAIKLQNIMRSESR